MYGKIHESPALKIPVTSKSYENEGNEKYLPKCITILSFGS